MADPYWRYSNTVGGAPAERGGSVGRPNFPGYFSSEATPTIHNAWLSGDASIDYLQKEVPPLRSGGYGMDDINGVRVSSDPIIGGFTAGASTHSYSSPLDSILLGQRWDRGLGTSLGIQEVLDEPTTTLPTANGRPVVPGESNILFVDRLPCDCTRREVGHLFRPFIGFKEIRVVHKEARHGNKPKASLPLLYHKVSMFTKRGDKATVLCFVEFDDAKCALTAMEALQSYKFDDKKLDSPSLKISFAHFPFRPPPDFQKERGSVRQQSR